MTEIIKQIYERPLTEMCRVLRHLSDTKFSNYSIDQFTYYGEHLEHHRPNIIEKFGFPIITRAAINFLLKHGNSFVDVGAGTGYLSHELAQAGADVVAIEPEPGNYGFKKAWFEREGITGQQAVVKYFNRTLIMSWPCFRPDWPAETLQAYPGQKFVYIGEGWGGCTGNARFHDILRNQWKRVDSFDIPVWDGIHDGIEVYVRKRLPRKGSFRWFAQCLAK